MGTSFSNALRMRRENLIEWTLTQEHIDDDDIRITIEYPGGDVQHTFELSEPRRHKGSEFHVFDKDRSEYIKLMSADKVLASCTSDKVAYDR
ncbi:MAG: hypothetical protein LBN30_09885 [Oscillospiraceae bacterium]|jgi:hypothetical protein|nr:hypothetical protein [Oscillospiraceae bacterium]